MVSYTTESIRNIALVGHGAAGKTTLVETLLHHAGKLPTPGAVEKGNTVCDFDLQEKAHQHSLDSALVNFDYDGAHINLIDTPGFPDFLGQFPRFSWSSDRRPAGGGNGSCRDQCPNRHRSGHATDDGTRGRTPTVPDDHRQ